MRWHIKTLITFNLGLAIGLLVCFFNFGDIWKYITRSTKTHLNDLQDVNNDLSSSRIGTTISSDLEHDVLENARILCLVLTSPKTIKTRGLTVLNTWGRRCNGFLFVNDRPIPNMPTMNITTRSGYAWLYNKTATAYDFTWRNYRKQFDWFLKADDDTYVIVENLRHLLKGYSVDEPLYFGDKLMGSYRKKPVQYAGGGAGYVFNRAALQLFTSRTETCEPLKEACPEDVLFGVHMAAQGVPMGESRDGGNKTRFHSANIYYLANKKDKMPTWYKQMSVYFNEKGLGQISDRPITFHYSQGFIMKMMEYLIYQLKRS